MRQRASRTPMGFGGPADSDANGQMREQATRTPMGLGSLADSDANDQMREQVSAQSEYDDQFHHTSDEQQHAMWASMIADAPPDAAEHVLEPSKSFGAFVHASKLSALKKQLPRNDGIIQESPKIWGICFTGADIHSAEQLTKLLMTADLVVDFDYILGNLQDTNGLVDIWPERIRENGTWVNHKDWGARVTPSTVLHRLKREGFNISRAGVGERFGRPVLRIAVEAAHHCRLLATLPKLGLQHKAVSDSPVAVGLLSVRPEGKSHAVSLTGAVGTGQRTVDNLFSNVVWGPVQANDVGVYDRVFYTTSPLTDGDTRVLIWRGMRISIAARTAGASHAAVKAGAEKVAAEITKSFEPVAMEGHEAIEQVQQVREDVQERLRFAIAKVQEMKGLRLALDTQIATARAIIYGWDALQRTPEDLQTPVQVLEAVNKRPVTVSSSLIPTGAQLDEAKKRLREALSTPAPAVGWQILNDRAERSLSNSRSIHKGNLDKNKNKNKDNDKDKPSKKDATPPATNNSQIKAAAYAQAAARRTK